MRRFFLIVMCALIGLVLVPQPVAAHANIVESTPAANSVVEQPPATARLKFSEPLEPSYSRAVLASALDGPVTTAPSRVDPTDPYTLLLDLPVLPEGQYTIQWRTLSTADGHTMEGTVAFGIGDPAAATAPLVLPPPPPNPLALPPLADAALRWLMLLSLSVVLGSMIFGALIWRSDEVDQATSTRFDRWARRVERGAAAVASIAALGMLVAASTTAQSDPFTFAGSSRVGGLLALRWALALALLAVLWLARSYRRGMALALGIGAAASISLLSHSAATTTSDGSLASVLGAAASIMFDLIHLLATAAWIGALPALLLGLVALRRSDRSTPASTLLITRFTGLATAAVITLAATGTYAALQHLNGVRELWTTTYGRALSIKLLLFGVLLLFGAYNRWRLTPLLARLSASTGQTERAAPLAQVRRSVGAEIAVSTVLLLAVGVLTATSPSNAASDSSTDFAETVTSNGVALSLQVVRGDVAGDTFAVTVQGLTTGVAPEAVVRAAMPAHGMPEQELALEPVEANRWAARAPLLTMQGAWNVEVIVRAVGMADLRHTFVVDTTPITTTAATSTPAVPLWATLLVLALIVASFSQTPLQRAWRARLQLGSLVLIVAAFVATTVPFFSARAREQTNPLEPTPAVLAAGQTIYQQNCVSCHGLNGRGDGPAAAALPGLPADFTVPHFATHTDAEVFGWIKSGKPGTAMPAFGEQLTDEQIWQVITHIRKIYTDAQAGTAPSTVQP